MVFSTSVLCQAFEMRKVKDSISVEEFSFMRETLLECSVNNCFGEVYAGLYEILEGDKASRKLGCLKRTLATLKVVVVRGHV